MGIFSHLRSSFTPRNESHPTWCVIEKDSDATFQFLWEGGSLTSITYEQNPHHGDSLSTHITPYLSATHPGTQKPSRLCLSGDWVQSFFSIAIVFFFLKYSWLTILCKFQVYSKVIQLDMYISIFFFFYSFPLQVIIVPCAIQ